MSITTLHRTITAVWHTARRELYVQLLSSKGRLVLSLFGLLGILPSFLRTQIAVQSGMGPARDEILQNQQLVALYGVAAATELSKCPTIVLAMGVVTLLALPFFVVLLAYDAISDDLDRGVGRLVLARVPRGAFFVGKLLGLWASLALLLFVLFAASAVIVAASGAVEGTSAIFWSAKFWGISSVLCFPYLTLTLFMSASALPSTRALLLSLGALFALGIARGYVGRASEFVAKLLFPGSYDVFLLSAYANEVVAGVALLSIWGAFWALAGIGVMTIRDV